MTKKQIAFWRLIILVILLGGAILIGRAIHKKPKTDSVQSEFVNSNDEDTVTTTEGSEINNNNNNNNNNKENIDSPTETKDSINSFEEDFKDDDNPDSVTKDSDNSSTDENAVVEEKEKEEQNQNQEKEKKVEPVEVDQTINLSIRSDDFFESPEEIDQTKVDKYDDSKNNNNKKLPNDNVTPSKKIHSLKNQEDQNNN